MRPARPISRNPFGSESNPPRTQHSTREAVGFPAREQTTTPASASADSDRSLYQKVAYRHLLPPSNHVREKTTMPTSQRPELPQAFQSNLTPPSNDHRSAQIESVLFRERDVNYSAKFAFALDGFLANPSEFYRLLQTHNAVATGAAVLWSAMYTFSETRPSWNPEYITLCIPRQNFVDFVADFIEIEPGGRHRGRNAALTWQTRNESEIWWETDRVCFCFMRSTGRSPFQPVLAQSGSHLLNVVTWNRLIIPYPTPTLRHQAVVHAEHDELANMAPQTFGGNFTLIEYDRFVGTSNFNNANADTFSEVNNRHFGDERCLILNFGGEHHTGPARTSRFTHDCVECQQGHSCFR